ncbi:HemK2/MTQ2 family protein methyltransferase [Antrihabitans stalactiti]|uniref:Methyltransferase n=1 Tax=Antrihabitans stalactiti TaxID=2584121 RepID=A0A848K8V0_9NOCA|nr:HemK2/MTQ2 family protein methyltransferase [Antrihabitans stalactiti]NMN93714.1 methyltransferase [Antrihabitans stalactiti]
MTTAPERSDATLETDNAPATLPRVFVPPGVYQPQEDSWLIAQAIRDIAISAGTAVLDFCTGSGVLALSAAERGATVVALDISRTAVLTARVNARLRRLPLTVRRGNLHRAKAFGPFDVVISNPPYVPALATDSAAPFAERWDAGPDGRAVLDPLCEAAWDLVRPGGSILIVHSAFSSAEQTLDRLRANGFDAAVVRRAMIPFGSVLRSRRTYLQSVGLCDPGCDEEELVVIRGDKPE